MKYLQYLAVKWMGWRLRRAMKRVEQSGLSVVRLREVAGTQYIENKDGTLFSLTGKRSKA